MASGNCQFELRAQYIHLRPSELEKRFALAYASVHHSCNGLGSGSGSQTGTRPLKVHLFTPEQQQRHLPSRRPQGAVTRTACQAAAASDQRRLGSKQQNTPAGVIHQYYGSENFGFTVLDSLVLETSAFTKVKRNKPRESTSCNGQEERRRLLKPRKVPDKLALTCANDKAVVEFEDSKSCRNFARSPCGASAARKMLSSPTASEEKSFQSSSSASRERTEENSVNEDLVTCPTCKEHVCQEDFPYHYLALHQRKRKASHDCSTRPQKILKQEPMDEDASCQSPTVYDSEEHRESPKSTDEVLHPVPIRFQVLPHPQWLSGSSLPYAHSSNDLLRCSRETDDSLTRQLIHPAAQPMHGTIMMRHPATPNRPAGYSEHQVSLHHKKLNIHRSHEQTASPPTLKGCAGSIFSSALPHPAIACQLEELRLRRDCHRLRNDCHPALLKARRKKPRPVVKQEVHHLFKSFARPASPGPPPPLISDSTRTTRTVNDQNVPMVEIKRHCVQPLNPAIQTV